MRTLVEAPTVPLEQVETEHSPSWITLELTGGFVSARFSRRRKRCRFLSG